MGAVDVTAQLTEQDYADFIALAQLCGVTPLSLASAIMSSHVRDSRKLMTRTRPGGRELKLILGGRADA